MILKQRALRIEEPVDEIEIETHEKATLPTFPCTSCDKKFPSQINLNTQVNYVQVHPIKYPCDIRWEIFETESGKKNHVRNFHQTVNKEHPDISSIQVYSNQPIIFAIMKDTTLSFKIFQSILRDTLNSQCL